MRITSFLVMIMFVIIGCSKTADVPISYKKIPVVNCIFSQDSIWKVYVSISGSADNPKGEAVPNASVRIFKNNQLIETLLYKNDGYYLAQTNTKPEVNTDYSLEVNIPGYKTVTAKDKIPPAAQTAFLNVDTTLSTYSYSPFDDPAEVFVATISFNDNEPIDKYYMITPYYYEKDELKIYKVTKATIDSLLKYRYIAPNNNDSLILSQIFDSLFYGKRAFEAKLKSIYFPRSFSSQITTFTAVGTFNTYYPDLFKYHKIYSSDIYFKQLQDYYSSVFGEKKSDITLTNYPLRLFLGYYPGGVPVNFNNVLTRIDAEIYLEISTLSNNGYKYFTTYTQNIANRTNPFTELKNVFSNIQNGAGIFAGANNIRVKIR
ncbi:MAG: DUF4249 domain-containing protein [Chitinophagaceae bacterium]|nr:DUF4249 domain-containing protein [Chitinophagaceae bacterium]